MFARTGPISEGKKKCNKRKADVLAEIQIGNNEEQLSNDTERNNRNPGPKHSKKWNPSKVEIQAGFVYHINTSNDFDRCLELLKSSLRQRKVLFQPRVVVLGPLSNIVESYVVVNETRYRVDSPLHAVNICFKIFFALNAEYPPEAKTAWLFLQKAVFEINMPHDRSLPTSLQSLMGDVKVRCKCSNIFKNFEEFIFHLKSHVEQSDLYYECLEKNCLRRYHNVKSFRQHLRLHTKFDDVNANFSDEYNESIIDNEIQCVSSFAKNDTFLKNSPSNADLSDEEEDEFLEWFALYEAASRTKTETEIVDVPVVNQNTFVDIIFRNNCNFLSALYNRPDIPRNVVHMVTEECEKLLNNEAVNFMRQQIILELSKAGAEKEAITGIEDMFLNFQNSLKKLSTEWKRFKAFMDSGFMPPTPVKVGIDKGVKLANHQRTNTDEEVFVQYIPLSTTLKQLLEQPTVFDRVKVYMKFLSEYRETICNFVQGELWQNISKSYGSELVLPIFLDSDDYESNNVTGSHSGGGGKMGGTYLISPFLPPEFNAKLENIFLVLLHNSADRKQFGNVQIYKELIKELKLLATEGIIIKTDKGYERVYFVLALLLGDNLGLNGIQGYVESFTGTNFCRICNISHKDAGTTCVVLENLIRTRESYDKAVSLLRETGKISMGVKEECIWNEVPNYHVTQNVCLDILHDGPEGTVKIILLQVLNHFEKEKKIIEILNSRLPAPLLDVELIKKFKLRLTASESLNLLRHLGMLIADCIPESDEFWELYVSLNEIIGIIHEKAFHPLCPDYLQTLVTEHLTLFRKLTNRTLTPKQHYLLHYALVMKLIGPMVFASSIKGERKHKEYKTNARASISRKNLPYTLALKNQLKVHDKFSKNRLSCTALKFGPIYTVDIRNLVGYQQFLTKLRCGATKEVRTTQWVEYLGNRYELEAVISKICSEESVFFVIKYIIINNDSETLFVTNKIENTCFDRHYQAFEILSETHWDWNVVPLKEVDYVTFQNI